MARNDAIPVWREVGATLLADSLAQPQPEVVIVGAGPVGLTLALDLGRRGRRVTVLHRLDFVAAGSKAICFSKRTLDIWQRLGVGEAMVARGVVWNIGKVFCGDDAEPHYQFDMLPVKNQRNPGFINLQQYHVEDVLIAALADLPNVDLRWGHDVTGHRQNGEEVVLSVSAAEGDYELSAPWAIACDGSRSSIREFMGLDFEGRVFEDNFLIADIRFLDDHRPTERWFWFDPPFNRGRSALLHKQPDDVWRCDFQLGWDVDRVAAVLPENVEPLVRGMLGADARFEREWYSIYTFQCRRMSRFVHGRTIFAGDSAHLVSPFGARGCNGGIADIDNLGWKLDAVLNGEAGEELLASYDHEAIVTADENIQNSSRSTDFMTPKSVQAEMLRDAVLDLARDWPFARSFVNSGRLSTAVSYPDSPLTTADIDSWTGGVAPGAPALDAPLADGGWLLDRLGDEFFLLGWDAAAAAGDLPYLDVASIDGADGLVAERYALSPGAACLIRPDQYVAARWRNPTPAMVKAAHVRALGRC